jgi:hypothetical protein
MDKDVIAEDQLAVRDLAAYLARLKAGNGEFVKVKRDLMVHLIEEKLEDAKSLLPHGHSVDREEAN